MFRWQFVLGGLSERIIKVLNNLKPCAVSIICSNLALATPAASPVAAMMFANTKWLKVGDLYKLCTTVVAIALVLTVIVGLMWANLIY